MRSPDTISKSPYCVRQPVDIYRNGSMGMAWLPTADCKRFADQAQLRCGSRCAIQFLQSSGAMVCVESQASRNALTSCNVRWSVTGVVVTSSVQVCNGAAYLTREIWSAKTIFGRVEGLRTPMLGSWPEVLTRSLRNGSRKVNRVRPSRPGSASMSR